MPKNPKRARKGTRKATSVPDDRAAELPRPEEGDPIEFEILVAGRPWTGLWKAFVEKYHSWWDRVGGDGPVYVLPIEVIESLAKGTDTTDSTYHPSKPLITAGDAEAERDFLRVCKGFQDATVGVWDGKPIAYPLLSEPAIPPDLPDSLLAASGLAEGRSLAEARRRMSELLSQLAGPHSKF